MLEYMLIHSTKANIESFISISHPQIDIRGFKSNLQAQSVHEISSGFEKCKLSPKENQNNTILTSKRI